MSNITSNRISVEIEDTELAKIKSYLQSTAASMPFLIGLTIDERIALPKMNDSNKTFVEDAMNAIINNSDMLPGYFNAKELAKDLMLFKQLDELYLLASQLAEKINDTRLLCGSEAYVTALTAYRLFDAAAKAGIAGADTINDLLKVRFAEQGSSAPQATTETVVAATN